MAFKFGKREKIGLGVSIGVVVIACIHLFFFKDGDTRFRKLEQERNSLKGQAAQLQSLPKKKDIEEYEKKTADYQVTMWNTIFDADVKTQYYHIDAPDPPAPDGYGTDEKVTADHDLAVANNRIYRDRIWKLANEDIALRLEHLVQMRKSYGSGHSMPGDPEIVLADGQTSPRMFLSFLNPVKKVSDKTWNLPLELPENLKQQANLLDEINRLYGFYDVVSQLNPSNVDYRPNLNQYNRQLLKMGMDIRKFPIADKQMKNLSIFIRFLHARLIANNLPEGHHEVGRQVPLTMDLLQQMYGIHAKFGIQLPRPNELQVLSKQLRTLELIISMGWKNGIEDFQSVQLLPQRDAQTYTTEEIDEFIVLAQTGGIKEDASSTVVPQGAGFDAEAMRAKLLSGGGKSKSRAASEATDNPEEKKIGITSLQKIRFKASNENAFRFLYDVTTHPSSIRIEDIQLASAPKEDNKILVIVTLESLVTIKGISHPLDGLFAWGTSEPLAVIGEKNIGLEIWSQRLLDMKGRVITNEDIVKRVDERLQ